MGKSASSSKNSDSSGKSKSSKLKDHARDIRFAKKHGSFVPDPSLEDYMEDEMRAVGVTWYLGPMKEKGYGLGHEFLVVDLQTPENCQLLIRAEKDYAGMGDEEYPPGGLIKATRIPDPPKFAKEHKDRVKYPFAGPVDLKGSGKISMKDLMDILGAGDRGYSWWKHNCWKYAYDTFKNLLEKFDRLADTSDDCKKNIREALLYMSMYPSLPAEILVEAGKYFLACWVLPPLTYWGAVGAIAAFKYLQGLKMALAARTTVKGLAGSSLFTSKSLTDLAFKSLAKRPWVGTVWKAYRTIIPVFICVEGFEMMHMRHSVQARKRDENS